MKQNSISCLVDEKTDIIISDLRFDSKIIRLHCYIVNTVIMLQKITQ